MIPELDEEQKHISWEKAVFPANVPSSNPLTNMFTGFWSWLPIFGTWWQQVIPVFSCHDRVAQNKLDYSIVDYYNALILVILANNG